MKFGIKYELANTHTGRLYDTMEAAAITIERSSKNQGISIVVVDGDNWRHLSEDEMDELANLCESQGIQA